MIKGRTGQMELEGSVIRISRDGILARQVGEPVEIDLEQVARIEFHPASMMTNGYLALIPHGQPAVQGVLKNTKNPYAVVFTKSQQSSFESLRKRLDDDLAEIGSAGPRGAPSIISKPTTAYRAPSSASSAQPENAEGARTQTFHTWYALVVSLVATGLGVIFVDPWFADVFGSGIPWWGYLIFFVVLFGGLLVKLAEQKAAENLAYGRVQVRPTTTGRSPNTERSGFCTSCGSVRVPNDVFCSSCGARLP